MNEQINPVAPVQPLPTAPITNSAPVTPTVKYAGFFARYLAGFIDSVITSMVLKIVTTPFIEPYPSKTESLSFSAFSLAATFLYFILMTHYKGTTLGKMVIGASVKSDDMQKLPVGRVVLRETVGKIASTITLMVGYIMAAFTEKKQALHDKIAHSIVVLDDPNKNKKWTTVVGAILFIITVGWFVVSGSALLMLILASGVVAF